MSIEGLPEGLLSLNVSDNRLSSLAGTPAGLRTLYASGNQLTSLEGAPARLRMLEVSSNQLTSLVGAPTELQILEASENELTSFEGAPAGLRSLSANANQLASLEGAPTGLGVLTARGNQLTSLEDAPAGLQTLDVGDNRLTSLPADLLTRFAASCTINLEDNPLSEHVRANLRAVTEAANYVGPQVYFSMGGEDGAVADSEDGAAARPLAEVVEDWLGAAEAEAWQDFAEEPGAAEYARFLDRLRDTVNFRNPAFRQSVVDDLRQAAAQLQLRQLFFEQAYGASASCEDRVTLTSIAMQNARLVYDVEQGAYDSRLGDLIEVARRLFCREVLERVAREFMQSHPFADEIEVYLAFLVKLWERLTLGPMAPDMRFFDVSHVTDADLDAAEARVRGELATSMFVFVAAKFSPWEAVLRRIAPKDYEAMQERLVEAMDGEFRKRLDERIPKELSGNPDAERHFGALIRDELTLEIKGELTRKVLKDNNLEHRLNPPAH
ncbi:NEL-type E3 ubiquitin ligase domain-containing protein [Ensifer adhaerens]|uniref:NEL-type E3 ubiquitin ligase domain-containing protein n=1 Tax=Ensifer adhaerens TaxID=106592 RepID=UPI0038510223